MSGEKSIASAKTGEATFGDIAAPTDSAVGDLVIASGGMIESHMSHKNVSGSKSSNEVPD